MLFLFIFIFCFSIPDISSMDPEQKYNSFLLNKTISASLTEIENMLTSNEIDNTINLQILCKKQLLLALYYALHINLKLRSNFTSWISRFNQPFEKFASNIITIEESSEDSLLESFFSIYCFLSDLIPHPYDENNNTREETISFLNMLMQEHLVNQPVDSSQNPSSFFPQHLATSTNIKKLITINIKLFKESTFFYSIFRESPQAKKSFDMKQSALKELYSQAQLADIEFYIYLIESEQT